MGRLVKRLSVGALLLVFALATSAFAQTEILVNGDLETWDDATTPTSWFKAENITKDSADVHGGTYCAKQLGGTKDLAQYVTVTPGYTYDITIWYKVTAGDGDDARIWSYWKSEGASIYDNGDELRGPFGGYFDNNGGVWSKYDTTVVAPETADTLYFELRAYSGSTVYWDDLSVVETAPPPDDPADYFIPKGAHAQGYVSLKAAVDSINANGVVGEINFVLEADTLREESFTFNAALDADNNVTVKPAPGYDVVLIVAGGASQGNGDQMIGFDKGYVTFDGSNDGTDSRNLIVTTEMTSVEVPFGLNTIDADAIVIKNLIINTLADSVSKFKYGVVSNDIGGNDFTVDNCQIGSAEFPVYRDGVAVWGDWTNGFAKGTVINNDIHAGARGISTYIAGPCIFANNNVTLYPTATSYSYNYGIYCSWVSGAEIYGNVVTSAEAATGTGVAKVGGIVTASHPAGAEFNAYNNMVLVADAAETVPVYGLLHMSSSNARNWNVYHNTFEVSGTGECYGIANSSTGPVTMDLKNNIIINDNAGNAASAAIKLVSTSTVLSSNNNILVSAEKLASLGGTDYADLADWKAAGYDTGSDSLAVTFVSATDLHLATPSDTDLDLVMPAVGIDTDIDGDARGTFYAYAGADEGTAYPASNDFELVFDDDTDVANWSHHTVANGYTVEAWGADSVLVLSDGGYSFGDERAVKATVGSIYKLSIDIKTSLWEGAGNNLDLSIQGLGNDAVLTSCITDGVWTTYTLIGIADAEDGYIRLEGYKVGEVDTVFVDNVVWDDQYMDVIPSDDIAFAKANYSYPDYTACIGIVTNAATGAPIFMQDATAGISLYDWDFINDGIVEEGDEILVIGQRSDYKGLVQLQKTDANYQVLSKGNVVLPELITVADLDSRDYQGMLIMIEDVDTVDGFLWPASGQDGYITLVDIDSNEFAMRIDKDSEIDGSTPPESWPLDLIGVVSEYNDPQVMPRYITDFLTNQAPADFLILNPADSAEITSMDDPEVVDMEMAGDTVKALFLNWTEAIDPEGDTLEYEMHFIGAGPEEELITQDTFLLVPLNEEEPYEMNGTYIYYFTATDPMGEMAYSDTNVFIFNFPAPPMIVSADVVLMAGVPTYYAEFDLPLDGAAIANFSVLDLTAPGVITPTAVDSIAPNAVMISAPLVEDNRVALVYTGLTTPGATVTVTDTTRDQTVLIPFSDAHPEDAALMLEGFEGTLSYFDKSITYSSTTKGITSASTFAASDEEAYEGSKSGKYTLLDDPAIDGGWFVRHYVKYPYTTTIKANSTILLMVKGTGDVDLALTIKDSGYERQMWNSVTLCENDWQVVSFDLANDEVESWINGNGVVEGETVTLCDLHIMSSSDEDAVIYIDGLTERQMLSPVDVTLSVMMHEWLRLGKFNLATDYVDVAGSMNGWDGSSTVTSDLDSDTTYSVTIPLMPYSTQYFKFRINGSWNDATAEFPYGGPARELVVGGTASEHTYWYNNDTLEVAIDGIPVEFALHQNYPNPFNPVTTINFDLPSITDVTLIIYDITGRKVRTLVSNSNIDAGYKKIVWNGRDDFGNGVATGMYIYRLIAGDFVDVKKMTFLK